MQLQTKQTPGLSVQEVLRKIAAGKECMCVGCQLFGIGIGVKESGGSAAVVETLSFRDANVLENGKWRPTFDPVLLIHEGGHLVCEGGSMVSVALRAAAPVLTSKFGDPDVLAKGGVPVLKVGDKGISRRAVIVNSNTVQLVERVRTLLDEILVPRFTARRAGRGRSDQVPAFVLEWHQILFYHVASVAGRHDGLILLIHLVHTHSALVLVELAFGIVEYIALEFRGGLGAPKHGTVHEIIDGSIGPAWVATPRIEPRDGAKIKVLDWNTGCVGPRQAHLAAFQLHGARRRW